MPDGLSVWQPQMISLKFSMCPGLEIYKLMNTQCDNATKIFYLCFEENISSERFQSRKQCYFCQHLSINHFSEWVTPSING